MTDRERERERGEIEEGSRRSEIGSEERNGRKKEFRMIQKLQERANKRMMLLMGDEGKSARASRGLGFCGMENNFWRGEGQRRGGEDRGERGGRGKTNQKYGPTNPHFQFWRGSGAKILISLSLSLPFRLMASFLSSAAE